MLFDHSVLFSKKLLALNQEFHENYKVNLYDLDPC